MGDVDKGIGIRTERFGERHELYTSPPKAEDIAFTRIMANHDGNYLDIIIDLCPDSLSTNDQKSKNPFIQIIIGTTPKLTCFSGSIDELIQKLK